MLPTVNQYYQEASYQKLSITADVYGPFNVPIDSVCFGGSDTSGFSTVANSGIQAAQSAGVDLSPYESYMFVVPFLLNGQCFGEGCGLYWWISGTDRRY